MFENGTIANFKEVEIAHMVKKVRNFKYKGWDYKSYEEDQIANMSPSQKTTCLYAYKYITHTLYIITVSCNGTEKEGYVSAFRN